MFEFNSSHLQVYQNSDTCAYEFPNTLWFTLLCICDN